MRQITACFLLILCSHAQADQAERLKEADFTTQWHANHEVLERKSEAVMTYLWTDVYAAAFFTEPSISPARAVAEQREQRLELYYFRDISRADVIKATNTTLRRQQDSATLKRLQPQIEQLHATLHNIRQGDRYALDFLPGQGISLECNGKVMFSSPDPEFARAYLAIWLAPNGLSDSLRSTLLSQIP